MYQDSDNSELGFLPFIAALAPIAATVIGGKMQQSAAKKAAAAQTKRTAAEQKAMLAVEAARQKTAAAQMEIAKKFIPVAIVGVVVIGAYFIMRKK